MIEVNNLIGRCIKEYDPRNEKYHNLELGKYYRIDTVSMGQSYTSVGIDNGNYNSVIFEFYKKCDIYHDSEYSPYIGKKNE